MISITLLNSLVYSRRLVRPQSRINNIRLFGGYNTNRADSIRNPSSLFDELRSWRNALAEELQKQPYHILKNKVLEELCTTLPRTPRELYAVPGVGPKTMTYGDKILDIISKYVDDENEENNKVLSSNQQIENEDNIPTTDTTDWWSTGSITSTATSSSSSSSSSSNTSPSSSSGSTTAPSSSSRITTSDDAASCAEFVEQLASATPKPRGRKKKEIPYVPSVSGIKSSTAVHNIHHRVTLESLTQEQKRAADEVLQGKNIFLTGSAGTGKSHVLKYIIQELQKIHGASGVAITAPTGVAAINVGGQTLHSFAGIGLGKGAQATLVSKVLRSKPAVERWESAKVLIIDEVSMLDMNLFNNIDAVARRVRYRPNEAFGGLQVVCVGDFFQLPPVVGGADKNFCFESMAWEELGLREDNSKIILKEVVRQSESEFVSLLNDIRVGAVTPNHLNQLDEHLISRKPQPVDGILPTRLYCTNRDVDKENTDRLLALDTPLETFAAQDVWKQKPTNAGQRRAILDIIEKSVPSGIDLKVGAQVMLLRNRSGGKAMERGLVNGSRGVIVAFTESAEGGERKLVPVVRFDDGQTIVVGYVETLQSAPGASGEGILSRSQLPLKLAWAVTVHKSQGSTLSRAVLEIASAFDYGQAYVALSRVSSLEGLWLSRPITEQSIKVHPKVLRFYGLDHKGQPLQQQLKSDENNNNNNKNIETVRGYVIPSSTSSSEVSYTDRQTEPDRLTTDEVDMEEQLARTYAFGEYDMAGEDSFDEHLG